MPDYCIGLLSGTSMDAVDAAIVAFDADRCTLVHTHSHPIPTSIRIALTQAAQSEQMAIDEIGLLDANFGELLANAALAVIESSDLSADQIQAIGSHGQTIRHRPTLSPRFTWQIGDPTRIVERTGITTVADFRRRDMAAGGEGAPLAPLFHHFRFTDRSEYRAVVNIGGIANITILPPDSDKAIVGFDSGPGNILMDAWIQKHHSSSFDRDGRWAETGQVSTALLQTLLQTDYLKLPAPKSTGRELFNLEWLEPQLEGGVIAAEDVQSTLLEFTARSITEALSSQGTECDRLLVCGGGANNTLLMRRLSHLLDIPVESTGRHGLPPEWVEAAAFAWFALLALEQRTSFTPPVTGAAHPVVLGAIYPA